jgi:hypothetical protein
MAFHRPEEPLQVPCWRDFPTQIIPDASFNLSLIASNAWKVRFVNKLSRGLTEAWSI